MQVRIVYTGPHAVAVVSCHDIISLSLSLCACVGNSGILNGLCHFPCVHAGDLEDEDFGEVGELDAAVFSSMNIG